MIFEEYRPGQRGEYPRPCGGYEEAEEKENDEELREPAPRYYPNSSWGLTFWSRWLSFEGGGEGMVSETQRLRQAWARAEGAARDRAARRSPSSLAQRKSALFLATRRAPVDQAASAPLEARRGARPSLAARPARPAGLAYRRGTARPGARRSGLGAASGMPEGLFPAFWVRACAWRPRPEAWDPHAPFWRRLMASPPKKPKPPFIPTPCGGRGARPRPTPSFPLPTDEERCTLKKELRERMKELRELKEKPRRRRLYYPLQQIMLQPIMRRAGVADAARRHPGQRPDPEPPDLGHGVGVGVTDGPGDVDVDLDPDAGQSGGGKPRGRPKGSKNKVIITEFYSLAMDSDRPKVLISNTDIGLDSGTHYFTVAFSIVPK